MSFKAALLDQLPDRRKPALQLQRGLWHVGGLDGFELGFGQFDTVVDFVGFGGLFKARA